MIVESKSFAAPGVRHAFFTRGGGVSDGIYASLNCGLGSGDDVNHVRENRGRAARALGLPDAQLCTVYQVHGIAVAEPAGPWDAEPPRADAMVTRTPGVGLGILTADCAPILFHDAAVGVIGAAHAGWKGALSGVAEATIAAMEALGARRDRIAAAIGPCIAQVSYEVGPDFPASFLEQDRENARFFTPADDTTRPRFDLSGYVRSRLAAAGIVHIDALAIDTYAAEDRFYSFRRATHRGETAYGRQLSAIALEK